MGNTRYWLVSVTLFAAAAPLIAHGVGGGGFRPPTGGMGGGPRTAGGDSGRTSGGSRSGEDFRRPSDGGRPGDDFRRPSGVGRPSDDSGRFDGNRDIDANRLVNDRFPGEMNLSRVAYNNQFLSNRVKIQSFSMNNLQIRGNLVRNNFYGNNFGGGWYNNHFNPWWGGGFGSGFWLGATWGRLVPFCGFSSFPVYYDYGTSVVYSGGSVMVQGESVGTPQQYSQQASAIAGTGSAAMEDPKDTWESLGVFAMVRAEEKDPSNYIQLAVNKDGILRGSYYNSISDTNEKVKGAVDKKTQRAAWTIGDKKQPVYEAGIMNLTREQTTALVHKGDDKVEQLLLFRIKPEDGQEPEAPKGR
ncbi:MAG: hypothetical protein FJ261_13375 [Planctomycetes bacterium]|nr:hypothetical protein [Planctomycetota bacterium]